VKLSERGDGRGGGPSTPAGAPAARFGTNITRVQSIKSPRELSVVLAEVAMARIHLCTSRIKQDFSNAKARHGGGESNGEIKADVA